MKKRSRILLLAGGLMFSLYLWQVFEDLEIAVPWSGNLGMTSLLMEGARMRQYDPAGRLLFEAQAGRVRHHPKVSADDGSEVAERIELSNGVRLMQTTPTQQELVVITETLTITPANRQAKTASAVQILSGTSETRGDSLLFDFTERSATVLSGPSGRVRSLFKPDPAQADPES